MDLRTEVIKKGQEEKDKRKWIDFPKFIRLVCEKGSAILCEQISRDSVYKFYDSLGMLLGTDAFSHEDKALLEKIAKIYLKGVKK